MSETILTDNTNALCEVMRNSPFLVIRNSLCFLPLVAGTCVDQVPMCSFNEGCLKGACPDTEEVFTYGKVTMCVSECGGKGGGEEEVYVSGGVHMNARLCRW